MLLRELKHEHIVRLERCYINRVEPSLSLAFDYAEHDLYEMIWHYRDRLQGRTEPPVLLMKPHKVPVTLLCIAHIAAVVSCKYAASAGKTLSCIMFLEDKNTFV
jgi:hypothetical protein